MSCGGLQSTSSSQRWVFITIFTPLQIVVTAGEQYMFCCSLSLSLFFHFLSLSTFHFHGGGQWTLYLPTGGKTTKATLQGQKKQCQVKSHCKADWIYTLAYVGESQRENTHTCPFQSPSNYTLSDITVLWGKAEYFMIYAPEDQKRILSLQRAKQFTWTSNETHKNTHTARTNFLLGCTSLALPVQFILDFQGVLIAVDDSTYNQSEQQKVM